MASKTTATALLATLNINVVYCDIILRDIV